MADNKEIINGTDNTNQIKPEIKSTNPPLPPEPKKQKKHVSKKTKTLIIILMSILLIFALLVIGHFLYKSCKSRKDNWYNVKVLQPTDEYSKYELTVNGKKDNFNVEYGSTLTVQLKEKQSFDSQYANSYRRTANDTPLAIFIQVTDQETTKKIWKSEQLHIEEGALVTQFSMRWNYDIVIQAISETNFDNFIYTQDEAGTVKYTYNDSIYNSNSSIFRINASTWELEEVERKSFNDPLWIGKKIDFLDDCFLSNCTGFNSEITFFDDGNLKVINNNFMCDCSSFNKEIVFPASLHTVLGHFMPHCTSFNNGATDGEEKPLSTKNITGFIAVREINESFLWDCQSFQQEVIFEPKLEWTPMCFMWQCKNYNRDITIPSTIKHMQDNFLMECDNYTSTITVNCPKSAFDSLESSLHFCATNNKTAECITKGMKVSGDSKDDFLKTFPNERVDEGWYRNLQSA